MLRDVGVAEELAQDALVAALEQWPKSGVPDNPAAWLTTAARHRAINHLRRNRMLEGKHAELGREGELSAQQPPALEEALDDHIGDDLLRLVFTACHPVLTRDARVALTLRLLSGLTTAEIAHAFLVSEPTIAQRIVRAKRTLADAQVPFEVPPVTERAARLASVLDVVYLVFNEGYTATAGRDLSRPELSAEALRLGRLLVELEPDEPEAWGLLALMELTAARAAARLDVLGNPVRLPEQDRTLWDRELILRGEESLARAEALPGPAGSFVLQAAVAACHARARTAEETDWSRIAALYAELVELTQSPVVELNRAVAVSMADGPAAGLALVDALASEPSLVGYHLLPSARAELLERLGRLREAAAEFERAAALTQNERQRARLLERARGCGSRDELPSRILK
jgi:RNA polymerase sigma factor (sigma-70 family)